MNQAMPSLLLSTCAVDPTEEGVALKMVSFSFILMDSFAAGLVAMAGSPSSHVQHCTIHPVSVEEMTRVRGHGRGGKKKLDRHSYCATSFVIFYALLV